MLFDMIESERLASSIEVMTRKLFECGKTLVKQKSFSEYTEEETLQISIAYTKKILKKAKMLTEKLECILSKLNEELDNATP